MELGDFLHREGNLTGKFIAMQEQYIEEIERNSRNTRKYGFMHCLPIVTNDVDQKKYKSIYETLTRVARRIATNYLKDDDVQEVIRLPQKAKELLAQNEDEEWKIGTVRPDFMIDENGELKINEINARFPFNGYYSSYVAGSAFEYNEELRRRGLREVIGNKRIPNIFSRIGSDVCVVKDVEADWDIAIFKEFLQRRGGNLRYCLPSKIGKLLDEKKQEGLVLEMEQEEIIDNFSLSQARELMRRHHINDLRTILIIHDKRLLAILNDEKLLRRYATDDEINAIKPHLIETYALDASQINRLYEKQDWVLKPALRGKAKGVCIGSDVSDEKWVSAFEAARTEPYVIQRRVKSKDFGVYIPHLGLTPTTLEGMMLGIDGEFVCLGMFKGKYKDTTRVSDGVVMLPSAIIQSESIV